MKHCWAFIVFCFFFSCNNKKALNENVQENSIVEIERKPNSELEERNPTPADNSRNVLDWKGDYKGLLPCADCDVVETTIKLSDENFELKQVFKGKKSKVFTNEGKFFWKESGSQIYCVLQNDTLQFLVGENKLIQLDKQGNKIGGNLAHKYILRKQKFNESSTYPITETTWLLTEINVLNLKLSPQQKQKFYLKLSADNNRLSAFMGCNSVSGNYELTDNNTIKFSKVMSTMMACSNMEVETKFNAVLPTVSSYYLNGEKLSLISNGKVVLNFVAEGN